MNRSTSQFWSTDPIVGGFRCSHCGAYVPTSSVISGVVNRNHCPYCLWSRHLDSHKAGDRLSACKEEMRPVGLTLKKGCKKYGVAKQGELMLIHLCLGCERISINRIAADDDGKTILSLLNDSLVFESFLIHRLNDEEVHPLSIEEIPQVKAQLFGLKTLTLEVDCTAFSSEEMTLEF